MRDHHSTGRRRRVPQPGTAIALLALFVALGGTAFAATSREPGGSGVSPEATAAKALGTKKLKLRKASVVVPAGGFRNGNYNSARVSVSCRRREIALSASTNFDIPDNAEAVTQFARLTVGRRGKPTGATASGATDSGQPRVFSVFVLCAR